MPNDNMPNANRLKDACHKLRINPSTFSDDRYDDNLMQKEIPVHACGTAVLHFKKT